VWSDWSGYRRFRRRILLTLGWVFVPAAGFSILINLSNAKMVPDEIEHIDSYIERVLATKGRRRWIGIVSLLLFLLMNGAAIFASTIYIPQWNEFYVTYGLASSIALVVDCVFLTSTFVDRKKKPAFHTASVIALACIGIHGLGIHFEAMRIHGKPMSTVLTAAVSGFAVISCTQANAVRFSEIPPTVRDCLSGRTEFK